MSEQDVFVAIDADGKVASRRVHAFVDCSFVKDDSTRRLTVAEQQLLGLKQCVVCTKRLTGGPAIDALKEIVIECNFGEPSQESPEGDAWRIFNALKARGFYIAQRQPKSS